MPSQAKAYAVQSATSSFAPFDFQRRDLLADDVSIEILFCGVCHSDLHTARNDWGTTTYPCVPGHEIVGRVRDVGSGVTKVAVGDLVGVGCMVDSCGSCSSCAEGEEHFCETPGGRIGTYDAPDRIMGGKTFGGYSDHIVVKESFVLRVTHDEADLAGVAPLLCAGITTYSPLRHWNVGPGKAVGVVGLGGLGHMAVKLASAMGAHVVVFTTSPGKRDAAFQLGADEVVLSTDDQALADHADSLDLILDSVAAAHDLNPYLRLLKKDGTLCLLGVPDSPHPGPNVTNLILRRRALSGSLIGSIGETQEMLDFCKAHNITADVEIISMEQVDAAYERMQKNDVKYRFSIDMRTLKDAA